MESFRQLVRTHSTKHRHFLLYSLIGLSGVALDFIAFAFGTQVLGMGVLAANFIAISLGIVNNFWLNTRYNFKKHDHLAKRFGLFYSVGLLGIVLSEMLIFLFHYGLGLEDLWAKLLTLPFVLVFQFLLNKQVSFGDMATTRRQLKRLFRHWPLFVLLTIYAICSLAFIAKVPTGPAQDPKNAPDEGTHYFFNVEHIMKHWSLPVAGVDDKMAYELCGTRPIGKVPCLYSYVVYPGPNYVASAVAAGIADKTGTISPRTAARVPSFLSGLAFVVFVYAAVYALTRRRLFATLLTACAAFIPQVIFVNSYVNLDAHSLAISAFLGFALVKFMLNPRSRRWQIIYAVALFGLLPVSKYNFFMLAIPGIALLVYTFIRQRFTRQEIMRFALYAFLSFLVLASFWYIRNTILYHDPLGQGYMLEKMFEAQPDNPNKALPFNLTSLVIFLDWEFFQTLFHSFTAEFGSMVYILEESNYTAVAMILLIVAAIFGYNLTDRQTATEAARRRILALLGLYGVTFAATLGLIIYNSMIYDYQPQGRYMFPVIVPTILLLAYAVRVDKRYRFIPFLLFAGILFLFLAGMDMFVQVYLGSQS